MIFCEEQHKSDFTRSSAGIHCRLETIANRDRFVMGCACSTAAVSGIMGSLSDQFTIYRQIHKAKIHRNFGVVFKMDLRFFGRIQRLFRQSDNNAFRIVEFLLFYVDVCSRRSVFIDLFFNSLIW